jgi:hypothetical protein
LNYEKRENRKIFELQTPHFPAPQARGGLRQQNGFCKPRFTPLNSFCEKDERTYFALYTANIKLCLPNHFQPPILL